MEDLLQIGTLKEDIAYSWIKALFPSDNEAYGAAFATFSSSMAFLGALMLGFFIVIGIVSSAHSGKVLGEKYHQIWAPLRVVLGFGMMIPLAGGFSSVHYMLRDVVAPAAINLANAPIIAYLDHMAKNTKISAGTFQGNNFVDEIIAREVCLAAVNAQSSNLGWGKTDFPPVNGTSFQGASNWLYGQCGTIVLMPIKLEDVDTEISELIQSNVDLFYDRQKQIFAEMIGEIRKELALDNNDKFATYVAESKGQDLPTDEAVSLMITEGILPPGALDLKNRWAQYYNESVSKTASEIFGLNNEATRAAMKARIAKYGFVAAGSYERELSRMSGIANTLANSGANVLPFRLSASYAPGVEKALGVFKVAERLNSKDNLVKGQTSVTDNLGIIDKAMSYVFPNLGGMLSAQKSDDPIGDMISLGHHLINIAGFASLMIFLADAGVVGMAGSFIAGAPAGPGGMLASVGVVTALSALGDRIIAFLTSLVVIFAIVGVLHAYVLPMIPMIMVFMMSLSWLILFLEASIAGVLWAFAFIRMDGQDFFDKNQAPGVTLVFNLFLRPALGMLAFIGGLILLPVLLNSLNLIWLESYNAQTHGGWFGIIRYIVGLILFSYMQWQLTLRTYSLIPTIADRVGHWMGFGPSHGYGDGQETGQMTGVLVGGAVATSRMGDALLKGSGKERRKAPTPGDGGGDDKAGKPEVPKVPTKK